MTNNIHLIHDIYSLIRKIKSWNPQIGEYVEKNIKYDKDELLFNGNVAILYKILNHAPVPLIDDEAVIGSYINPTSFGS